MIDSIGIVGQGFVGGAVRDAFCTTHKVHAYDKSHAKCSRLIKSIKDLVAESDIIFVCVPTPMKKSGECDISIVEDVLAHLNVCNKMITVLIKSTMPPGTTRYLNKKYANLNIIFNPEFLTEANAFHDYKNQNRVILGGGEVITKDLINMFKKQFPKADIITTGPEVAEMIKYTTNTFLSTKVAFANEIYQICQKLNIEYEEVVSHGTKDNRLGLSHWSVPGPDGDLGYGGHCFPKDIAGLKYAANKLGVDTKILNATISKNDEVRKDRNWEKQTGRAVTE
tara:strand:- start:22 stop:864 length:843 start_codon:yes stop_codon:yes gene_type:complete